MPSNEESSSGAIVDAFSNAKLLLGNIKIMILSSKTSTFP